MLKAAATHQLEVAPEKQGINAAEIKLQGSDLLKRSDPCCKKEKFSEIYVRIEFWKKYYKLSAIY